MGGDRAIGMLHGRVHWSNLDSIRTLRHITRYSWSFTTIMVRDGSAALTLIALSTGQTGLRHKCFRRPVVNATSWPWTAYTPGDSSWEYYWPRGNRLPESPP